MRAEWSNIKAKQNAHYRLYRKNCSNIVSRVLRAGTKKGSPATRHSLIWTPLKVKRFGLDIGASARDWPWLVGSMEAVGMISDGERDMLADLGKRDSKHGSNDNKSYFAGGRRINPQIGLVSVSGNNPRFAIGYDPERPVTAMMDGSLYSGANINAIEAQFNAANP